MSACSCCEKPDIPYLSFRSNIQTRSGSKFGVSRTSGGVVTYYLSQVTDDPSIPCRDDRTWNRTTGVFHETRTPPGCIGGSVPSVYTDEYTTSDLLTRVGDSFGVLPDPASDGMPHSQRYLGTYEASATLQRTKWSVVHTPTPTCYLKVWLETVFQNPDGDIVSRTPIAPYEWRGEGNPCFEGDDLNAIEILSEPQELLEPDENGYLYVNVVKFSIVEGYVPDDPTVDFGGIPLLRQCPDPKPNGFPDPASFAGCTDSMASNYDPSATCDDGSCTYEDWF